MLVIGKLNWALPVCWEEWTVHNPSDKGFVVPKKLNSSTESTFSPCCLPLFLRDKRAWEKNLYQDLLGMKCFAPLFSSAVLAGTLEKRGQNKSPTNFLPTHTGKDAFYLQIDAVDNTLGGHLMLSCPGLTLSNFYWLGAENGRDATVRCEKSCRHDKIQQS